MAAAPLDALDGKRYLNLETYRTSGVGVRTPVWFALSTTGVPTVYVYSTARSGKAKRIRRSGLVKVAPCDMRGGVTGRWFDARASIVAGEEYNLGMRLLNRKYRPWKQMLDLFSALSRQNERIMIAIRPA